MSMQAYASCSGARRSVVKREVIGCARRAHDTGVRPVHPASVVMKNERIYLRSKLVIRWTEIKRARQRQKQCAVCSCC